MAKRKSKQLSLPWGRRPRKHSSLLKVQGYSLSDINDCIRAMFAMDMQELLAVDKDARATILEKTVARAMLKCLKSGSLQSVKTLLNRVYGTPRQTIEQNIKSPLKINVRFNDDTGKAES